MKIKAVNVDNIGSENVTITEIEPKKEPVVEKEKVEKETVEPELEPEKESEITEEKPTEPAPTETVEITDEMWSNYLKEKHGVESIDELKQSIENKPTEPQSELPADVKSFLEWREANNGGTISEYSIVTRDWNDVPDSEVLTEYMKLTKKHLAPEEIDFEINRMFSVDEELDSESDIMAKKIAKKDFLQKARNYFEETSKNFKPSRLGESEIPSEYKEALAKYKESVELEQKQQSSFEKQRNLFKEQTDKYFSEEFKGFEFKVGENESKLYMPSNIDSLKESNLDITNMLSKYVNKDGSIKDVAGYHRAISIASDPEGFAKFFIEQGRAEGVEDVTTTAKNRQITPRTTLSNEGNKSKIRPVSIGGSDYKFKLKQ